MTVSYDYPDLEVFRQLRIRDLLQQKEEKQNILAQPKFTINNTPVTLATSNFAEFIEQIHIVLVDFWADWCSPCKRVDPILKDIVKKYVGKIWVGKVNVDQQRKLAMKYGANSIPTF